jgi:ABC-type Na+ efflux pump permease subunit
MGSCRLAMAIALAAILTFTFETIGAPKRPAVIIITSRPGAEPESKLQEALRKVGYEVEISLEAANRLPDEGSIDYFVSEDKVYAKEIEEIARKYKWKGSAATLDTRRNLGHLVQVWFSN